MFVAFIAAIVILLIPHQVCAYGFKKYTRYKRLKGRWRYVNPAKKESSMLPRQKYYHHFMPHNYGAKTSGNNWKAKKGGKKKLKSWRAKKVPRNKLWFVKHPHSLDQKKRYPTSPPSPMPPGVDGELSSMVADLSPRSTPLETAACYADFHSINILEIDADVSQKRSYVICPNSVIETDDHFFLGLRPNMEILCGEDGSSSNSCLVTNGILGIGANTLYYDFEYLANVEIRGFTFDGLTENGSFITLPGEIVISDCIFKNMANFGPAFGAWFPDDSGLEMDKENIDLSTLDAASIKNDGRKLTELDQAPREPTIDDILDLTYENCVFEGNSAIELPSDGTLPGMVVSQGQTVTKFKGCRFEGNSYGVVGDFSYGALIIVEAGEAILENNCFVGNEFEGPAPVLVVYGAAVSSGNYQEQDPEEATPRCNLVAVYDSLEGGLEAAMATCIETDSETCNLR